MTKNGTDHEGADWIDHDSKDGTDHKCQDETSHDNEGIDMGTTMDRL